MAPFLLENRDFLGFWMIFNLYLMVHSSVLKFEKNWLSHMLNIIRKPKKSLFSKRKKAYNSWTVNVKYTVIELTLYLMFHSIVFKV